jgi:hypothetical protein
MTYEQLNAAAARAVNGSGVNMSRPIGNAGLDDVISDIRQRGLQYAADPIVRGRLGGW